MRPARLFDGKTAAEQPVLAEITGRRLDLHALDGTRLHSWPVDNLIRANPDAPADAVLLRNRSGPERLAVSDATLLANLRHAGARLGGRGAWQRHNWAALAGGILASLAGFALMIDRLPALATPFVPYRVEYAWSSGIQSFLMVDSNRCTGSAGRAALATLIGTLSRSAGLPAPPQFAVLNSPIINAFTLPDGRVLILRGLIAHTTDPDELSGVLAHELGHALHHDPTREMLRRLELNMLARSLGWGANLGSEMAALSYGRHAEAAADASALRTLRHAGLRADGLSRFLGSLRFPQAGEIPAFLSDHPSTSDRESRLQTTPDGASAMSREDWAKVKAICD